MNSQLTLKQISNLNPSSYKVIDDAERNFRALSNDDRIEILVNGKEHKECTRKYASKYGLCSKQSNWGAVNKRNGGNPVLDNKKGA